MAPKIDIDEVFESIDLATVKFTYDRDSDTLMIHLGGRGIPAISITHSPGIYVRWDPVNQRATAIQFENFVAGIVSQQPSLLKYSKVFGLPRDDVEVAQRVPAWRVWTRLQRPHRSEQVSDSPQGRRLALGSLQPLFS